MVLNPVCRRFQKAHLSCGSSGKWIGEHLVSFISWLANSTVAGILAYLFCASCVRKRSRCREGAKMDGKKGGGCLIRKREERASSQFKDGILAFLETDVACHLLVEQAAAQLSTQAFQWLSLGWLLSFYIVSAVSFSFSPPFISKKFGRSWVKTHFVLLCVWFFVLFLFFSKALYCRPSFPVTGSSP